MSDVRNPPPYDPYIPNADKDGAQGANGNQRTAALQAVCYSPRRSLLLHIPTVVAVVEESLFSPELQLNAGLAGRWSTTSSDSPLDSADLCELDRLDRTICAARTAHLDIF